MREPITQLDDFGCGAACVAFAAKVSYAEVVEILGKTRAETKGFTCNELCGVLCKLGKNYEYKYLKPRLKSKIYQNDTIVFIKRSSKYPYGHYLIRTDGLWMDPWVNFINDKQILNARSGFRKRLPGKPIYALFLGYYKPVGTRISVFSQYNFGDSNNSGVENLKQNSRT